MFDALALVAAHIAEPTSVWGIGAYGALAEFRRDADEPLLHENLPELTLASPRGAMRLDLTTMPSVVAYETLSAQPGRWLHGVAFTLAPSAGIAAQRNVLTEIGNDDAAILKGDRNATLFDLGLGTANVDVHVRTDDPELVTGLRQSAGQSVVAGDGRAMALIKEANPHRVFASTLGRIEVYAPLGSTRHNRPTPDGPHTHVLPQLLAARRTHPATIDLGGGLPCLWLYPASPTHDFRGEPQEFDPRRHDTFQEILFRHGAGDYVTEKRRAVAALAERMSPDPYEPPSTRLGRAALRVAIRQSIARDGENAYLAAWRNIFDTTTNNLTPRVH